MRISDWSSDVCSSDLAKLLTGFAGGSLPAIGQVGNSWLAEMAAIGAIAPVPRTLHGLLADQFDAVVDTNRIAGRLWGVPWYVDTRLQYYRRDLFARAGHAAPPRAWDGWKRALQGVKKVVGDGTYALLLPLHEFEQLRDRKSGVAGKSVAVRLILGVRRH